MPPTEPADFRRRILVSAVGLTPQVVTETLYALVALTRPSFRPTETHLVTTREGARRARLMLLDRENGVWSALCREYDCPEVADSLAEERIHVIAGADGGEFDDIASPEANAAAADRITALLRDLSRDGEAALHVSIAGGRKTISFLLGYALSLFGRPQDRLSHVLVDEPFESHPQFFYPPRKPRILLGPGNRPVSTEEARVTLAEIPFVRLRHGLLPDLLEGEMSYSDTVGRLQDWVAEPALVIDRDRRLVSCQGRTVKLSPLLFAWLAWFAERRLRPGLPHGGALHWSEAQAPEFLAIYRDLFGAHGGAAERVEQALADGIGKEYFEQKKSSLGRVLTRALGPMASRYGLCAIGRRPLTRFGLGLEPHQIVFGSLGNGGNPRESAR